MNWQPCMICWYGASDPMAAGETLLSVLLPMDCNWPAAGNIAEVASVATAETPAAAPASFGIHWAPPGSGIWSPIGAIAFAAGAASGVISASAVDSLMPTGSRLRVVAPTPQDAALAGVAITLVIGR